MAHGCGAAGRRDGGACARLRVLHRREALRLRARHALRVLELDARLVLVIGELDLVARRLQIGAHRVGKRREARL